MHTKLVCIHKKDLIFECTVVGHYYNAVNKGNGGAAHSCKNQNSFMNTPENRK